MKFDLKRYKIGEIAKVIGGGTPATKNNDYYGGDIPWITPRDLSNYKYKYISSGERNITEAGLKESSAKLLPKDTVMLSSRAPIGYVAISGNSITTNQGFKNFICNEKYILPQYLYYFFKANKENLEFIANGSTFKEISGKVIKNFEISLPSVDIQKQICDILKPIDLKIELNYKLAETLDQIVKTIFDRYLIEFEFLDDKGKNYKSNGGKMVKTEFGEVPEGWYYSKLKDIVKIKMGLSPKGDFYNNKGEGLPLLNGAADFIGRSVKPKKFTTDPKKVSKKGDLIFSIRGTIGNLNYSDREYAIGRGIAAIEIEDKDIFEIVWQTLERELDRLINRARGSIIKGISKADIEKINMIIPEVSKIKDILFSMNSLRYNLIKLNHENVCLEEIRSILIPELLSGEVDIPCTV